MINLNEQMKKHADAISRLNNAIETEHKACMDILEKYVNDEYIGKFIKAIDNYCYIKEIISIKPTQISSTPRYMVSVNADIYTNNDDQFGLLIRYNNRPTVLFFDIDGKHPEHYVLADFKLSEHTVLDEFEQTVLLDHDGDFLHIGDKVHFFENDEVIEGVAAGFDFETKKIRVGLPNSNDTNYRKISSRCLIKID